jgi:hypothetical protein
MASGPFLLEAFEIRFCQLVSNLDLGLPLLVPPPRLLGPTKLLEASQGQNTLRLDWGDRVLKPLIKFRPTSIVKFH